MTATSPRLDGISAASARVVRAAVYVRISHDRIGAGLGIARQEEDCRALCRRKGWTVIDVYADNDVSAYSGKRRPEWERLISDVAAGRIDAVVCWHVDRLTRAPRELEDVIDLADRHHMELAVCTGEIDLATPTGRMVARMMGAAARHESEHKAERQRRQARQAASMGANPRSAPRGFGHTRDRTALVEDEAAVVRECATRVLAGESLKSVAALLNTRGVITSQGHQWTTQGLRLMLASARISGRREYKPTDSYEHTRPLLGEITATGCWPAIISPADSDSLRALLSDPSRRVRNHTTRSGRYLLSGVFRCALCGGSMSGRAHNGKPRYACIKAPGFPGCGKVTIMAGPADREARDLILTALNDSPDLLPALLRAHMATIEAPGPDDPGARLREIDEQRSELARLWAHRDISRREWAEAKAELDTEADALTSRLSASVQARTLAQFAGLDGDMWQRWEHPAMTRSARRALIQACVTAITVHPANPRKRWDPDRIQPDWIV